jgi:hypothetical protein
MTLHQTADFDLHPATGWFAAVCTCGYTEGPFPDPETMVDALMWHAETESAAPLLRDAVNRLIVQVRRWAIAKYGEAPTEDEFRSMLDTAMKGVKIENSQSNEEAFGFEPRW